MKKLTFLLAVLTVSAGMLFAEGGVEKTPRDRWAGSNDNALYTGESEITFTYEGLQETQIEIFQNGSSIGTITAGESKRRIIPDGQYTYETQAGRGKKTVSVTAASNATAVKILVRRIRLTDIFMDFSIVSTTVVTTERSPYELELEANRYDPARFTLVPDDFKPADYKKVDLFDAVVRVEKMLRGNGSFGDALFTTVRFVSDVVFVNQNGADIQFKTADGAISQYMKIGARSGLSSGQRVRLYYLVTKNPLTEWEVKAIERL